MAEVYCSYEGKKFPDTEFDGRGVHVGKHPKHLLTGELVRETADGDTPFDVPNRDG